MIWAKFWKKHLSQYKYCNQKLFSCSSVGFYLVKWPLLYTRVLKNSWETIKLNSFVLIIIHLILLVLIFSGNGRWYRALVLKVSQSTVKVLYADCGNTETLPVSHVLPITDSYLKFPFQTITCSLAGNKKKTKKKQKFNINLHLSWW